jgi:ATP-dependent DNA ligase
VKWDGFRCLVDTHDGCRAISGRRWDMTELLPELRGLPEGLTLDAELVAFRDGLSDFPLLCDRMLHRRPATGGTGWSWRRSARDTSGTRT